MNMNGRAIKLKNQMESKDKNGDKDLKNLTLEDKFLIWMIDENRRT